MTTGAGLSVVEAFVESEDRTKLLLRSWHPPDVRAVVVAVHGPGSDGARYRCLAHTLAARGIATHAIDLRGCGRSSGARRRMASIDRRLSDVRTLVTRAMQTHPGKPLFMLGHGAGAMLACHHALRHDGELDGIVCEAIVLDAPWTSAIVRTLSLLTGRVRRPLAELSLPLLLLHGSHDRVAPPSGSERLHRRVASRDRTLLVFEGYDHVLVDGPGHALVLNRIGQWIEAQLDSRSRRRRIGIQYINE